MGILLAVLTGFAVAVVAPLLHRARPALAGWVLASAPLGIAAYFATFLGRVAAGEVIEAGVDWVPALGISLSFYLDGLSLLFALLISIIGALVVLYASSYLHGHYQMGRFYSILLMFMASMLGLVLAGNLIALFVFWELTSITSYLLIGFDHHREKARRSALKALLVTGTGGLALLAGFVLIGMVAGSLDVAELLADSRALSAHALAAPILLLILLGAFTKSAQVPFHFWLPNAMEAPTPVSAYLHSATMVQAGVYLLARLNPIIGGTDIWAITVAGTGALTMVVGAVMALGQSDIKRVLAYSTVSILGMSTMLIGIGTDAAIKAMSVLIVAHALYKASLFLVAGAVEHETGTRDSNLLGGLSRQMPITAVASFLSAGSMIALPLFVGFIGKEAVYKAVLETGRWAWLLGGVAVVAGILMVALAWTAGVGPFTGRTRETPKHPHEAPPQLWVGPIVLAGLGIVAGIAPNLVLSPLLSAAASAALGRQLSVHLLLWEGFDRVLGLSAGTLLLGLLLYRWRRPVLDTASHAYFLTRHGPEHLYDLAVAGMNGLAALQTKVLQSGYLRYYTLTIIITAVGLVGFTMLRIDGLSLIVGRDDMRLHEVGVATLILVAAVAAAALRSRLAAVAALGTVGYGVAAVFIFFGAPDLAMTQVLIETLAVILFVLVFYHLPSFPHLSRGWFRLRDALVCAGAGIVMTVLVLLALGVQYGSPISAYFSENSLTLANGRNIVNVVLVDFRAMDTLGEITVLAVAALGVYGLLKSGRGEI